MCQWVEEKLGIGIDFKSIKIAFFCGCFQNIQHPTNDCTLVEFHLKIYDNTATPKIKKILLPCADTTRKFPELAAGLILIIINIKIVKRFYSNKLN